MSSSDKKPTTCSLFTVIALCAFTAAASIWTYHNYVLRPWEVVTVDFRRLSDAKLGQLAERAMAGQPTNVAELEGFIQEFQANLYSVSKGRLVFTSGTVLNSGARDLTEELARVMGLDLAKGLEASLPGMANRIGGTLSRNLDGSASNSTPQRNQ
ncbi:MAG: hypothetical protein DELT_02637 [Desulfovibrio sp.]